ncbi:MAG: acyl-[acyl-carrier-protein] thioesterase [Hyphomicrobiales bacterium]
MEKQKIWTEDHCVGFHEVDFSGQMHLHSLFNYFQEAAWNHAGDTGFGFDFVTEKKMAWVIFQVDVEIIKYPKWLSKVKVKTWPCRINRLFAEREYMIVDKEDNIYVKCSSQWLIIDMDSRKPIRPYMLSSFQECLVDNKLLTQNKIKLDEDFTIVSEHEYQVQYSDIDVNGHANNSKYVEWIFNHCYQLLEAGRPERFSINFISESRLKEKVKLELYNRGDEYICIGKSIDRDKTLYIAKFDLALPK